MSFLKLPTLNELIQTFRVNDTILEPMLKTLFLCFRNGDITNNENTEEIGKDIAYILLKLIGTRNVCDQQINESLMRLSVINLVALQKYFPQIKKELESILLDFEDGLK